MTQARSTLEALIANDPSHPAIRYFLTITQFVLESKNLKGREEAAIRVLQEEMISLENKLTYRHEAI